MEEPQKNPVLGMRCAKCGAVYMAQALAYPISPDVAEMIAEYVRKGDEPFISYEGVRLGQCTCVMKQQTLKRRANLLYRLRKHGITADTKQRVIFIPYGESPWKFPQVGRLSREFYFNIQFIIT